MNSKTEVIVPPEAGGERLDTWLAGVLSETSRSAARRMIDRGLVRVDGRTRPASFRLPADAVVTVDSPSASEPTPAAAQPTVVFEDDVLIVVDKPAGLVVHPAPGHRAETLAELLDRRGGSVWSPYLVHRLDRDTSGLMVVAKNEHAQSALQAQLRRRELSREYLALVAGRLGSASGTIDAPIGRDRRRRTRMSTDTSKPRDAITHFTTERATDEYSLLRVHLETGRTHQIRAHLEAIGHPVCGDAEYGGGGLLGLKRQFLHSARIALVEPETGERLEWESQLPADLAQALERAYG